MSGEGNRADDGERTLDGAKAPGWENVAPPQQQGVGQLQILPPVPQPGQGYGYQGQQNYPPPQQGQQQPWQGQQAWAPPQGQYPPPPQYGAQPGQNGYRPVYDGRQPQGYPPPQGAPPQPGQPFMYNGQPYGGQYPPPYPQSRYGANGAEFLAAAAFLPWWRRRWWRGYGSDYGGGYRPHRRHFFFWPLLSFLFFFFLLSHGCRMILHEW